MKRAEKKHWQRVAEKRAQENAERLAIDAMLDHRITDSGRLVQALKNPRFTDELSTHGNGPTGIVHTVDVVRRYLRIIGQRTGGDALSVLQHLIDLLGKEQAEVLGINVRKIKVSPQSVGSGSEVANIKLSDHDTVAIAAYLTSPAHLNLGNLPPDPFGNPRVAKLMAIIRRLNDSARWAPDNPYRGQGGPTTYQLQGSANEKVDVVVNEISRVMPSNAAREAALKAMRLTDCISIYTPHKIRQTSCQDFETRSGTRIAVYRRIPGSSSDPTRYRVKDMPAVTGRLLRWYGA